MTTAQNSDPRTWRRVPLEELTPAELTERALVGLTLAETIEQLAVMACASRLWKPTREDWRITFDSDTGWTKAESIHRFYEDRHAKLLKHVRAAHKGLDATKAAAFGPAVNELHKAAAAWCADAAKLPELDQARDAFEAELEPLELAGVRGAILGMAWDDEVGKLPQRVRDRFADLTGRHPWM